MPAQKTAFETAYQSIVGKIAEGEARERGISFGNEVGKAYVEARSKDGMSVTTEYKPRAGPGQWKPTPPSNAPMVVPQLADVVPFTTKDFGFLKVQGPPPLDSAAYARDVDEVSTNRFAQFNYANRRPDCISNFLVHQHAAPWQAAARAAARR